MRALLLVLLLLLCGCGDDSASAGSKPSPSLPTELKPTADYSGDNAYVHCAALCALGPRPSGSPAYREQVAYLASHLKQAGWQVQVQAFEPRAGRSMQNVHATFGSSSAPRSLLLSCHIDTKQGLGDFVGADDGASGAAALLELARVLAAQPQLAEQVELVFFDGEESFGSRITEDDGLYGSRYDVQRREQLPRYLINLDMVGGAGKTIVVPVLDTSADLLEHYLETIAELGLSEDRWTVYPGSFWDDHRPFFEAGVETLNLIADFHGSSWWHTSRDNLSRISPNSLGETGRVVLQLIRRLLSRGSEGEDQSS